MTYTIQDIARILQVETDSTPPVIIQYLLTDSRKIVFPEHSLFFAIGGPRRDGHDFIREVYERGVRCFVVREGFDVSGFPGALFLKVQVVLKALQLLAKHHRNQFQIPVIGITGSNGKTIVKEWLYQLLQKDYQIIRSPRSYNSQIGVPLSVWQMNETHTLAIFEAGISTAGEMSALAAIIQPTIGVFTNLGEAHNPGFKDQQQKAIEKSQLFTNADTLVYAKDGLQNHLFPEGRDRQLFPVNAQMVSWSREEGATLLVKEEKKASLQTQVSLCYQSQNFTLTIPFTDRISIDNSLTCCTVMLAMGYSISVIQERLQVLEPVDMRMQLKKAINNCYLINDSYSNDLVSLTLALDFLQQQAGKQKTTLILSDVPESGLSEDVLYREIAKQVTERGIRRFIGIGPSMIRHQNLFAEEAPDLDARFYPSTENFLADINSQSFRDEYILVKGARVFSFERISVWLEQKVHQTVMEINVSAMVHNLKEYQNRLAPSTRLMAMVKAFSYGSGSAEIARILQFHKVDYLAVAYADEGVELRKAGISLPIMVMNMEEAGFDSLVSYDLEPEIYSFPIYTAFHHYLDQQGIQQFPVHIKINTGMNRLGFEPEDVVQLSGMLRAHQTMAVKTVFSHLVASESAEQDGFTQHQVGLFRQACTELENRLGYNFIKHIANTAAIHRNPEYQFDMVRLGIGLYGVDVAEGKGMQLETVATLKSTIAQLRKVKAGETIGYGRKGVVLKDSLIATVRIGYADGFSRKLGLGRGKMYVQGKLAPVIGQVCMDMTMLDVTGIPDLKEGGIVEIFGKNLPIEQVAAWSETIAYEVMTGISQRVKRVYLEE
ncbi:MAG: bifunctional UDP-N-acetylmuramoyl-tripeptide:D-alanyl-D-alanine ligase/alanine racemase [Bacteroidota bacterium]|nr:bifunctional UDP-N-acetylmuramoyl-tripeptide:D-alanyl-D-alanine ligase/alanine racemase [Bacteroidota bacterium]